MPKATTFKLRFNTLRKNSCKNNRFPWEVLHSRDSSLCEQILTLSPPFFSDELFDKSLELPAFGGLRSPFRVPTGIARSIGTNEQGRYQAPNLSLGNYEVQAQRDGFQTEVRRGIVLTVGREAVVNFELQVGAVAQTVEITGEAPLVETTGSSVSGVIDTKQITDLPWTQF